MDMTNQDRCQQKEGKILELRKRSLEKTEKDGETLLLDGPHEVYTSEDTEEEMTEQ
jgi:hypothetical protein